MAPLTPNGEPSVLVSASSWRWRVHDLTDYPNSEGWALLYRLAGASVVTITPTFQTSGDDLNHWLVDEDPADTDLTAGRYDLFKYVTGSGTFAGRRDTIETFTVSIKADPVAAVAGAFQTSGEVDLAEVRKAISARLKNDVPESYSIAGRNVSKIPLTELYRIESRLVARVRMERTGKLSRKVEVVFQEVGA